MIDPTSLTDVETVLWSPRNSKIKTPVCPSLGNQFENILDTQNVKTTTTQTDRGPPGNTVFSPEKNPRTGYLVENLRSGDGEESYLGGGKIPRSAFAPLLSLGSPDTRRLPAERDPGHS